MYEEALSKIDYYTNDLTSALQSFSILTTTRGVRTMMGVRVARVRVGTSTSMAIWILKVGEMNEPEPQSSDDFVLENTSSGTVLYTSPIARQGRCKHSYAS